MTAALPIAPVIPPPSRVAGTPRVTPAAVRPLPMAGPAAALSVPADVVYGIGRIDASGRVTDQAIACALGWREGDRLTLTASPGVVTARRDPGGMVTVPARACIAIPAVLRRRCGLRTGDRVLLAAVPGQDTLDRLLVRRGGSGPARPRHVPARPRRTAVTTPHLTEHPSQQAIVDAALLMLQQMGLSPADLVAAPRDRPPVPTFAEYVPVVSAAVTAGTPPGVRLVLEPGPGALGRAAAGRADPVGDPAADVVRQDPRRGPPQRPRRAQRHRAPGRRAALPVPARRGRRAHRPGREPGPEGGQAAPPALDPPGGHR